VTDYSKRVVNTPKTVFFLLFLGVSFNLLYPYLTLDQSLAQHVVWALQLPQVLTAVFVGSALSASAAVLQVLLRNTLADPGMIGISSGASLFATFVLLTPLGQWQYLAAFLPLICFVGALCSTLLLYVLAQRMGFSPVAVILAGIAISTVFSAIMAWCYLFADANQLRDLTFWLMGSLQHTEVGLISLVFIFALPCVWWLYQRSGELNLLYLGTTQAQLQGVNVTHLTRIALLVCAILVGLSVSLAGSIAFVGLLVPHIVRRWVGQDNRQVVLLSAVLGAVLLLCIVTVNTLIGSIALPVSLLTASIGGPVFIYILLQRQRRAAWVQQ
jgi:iron complex transport system permease protein